MTSLLKRLQERLALGSSSFQAPRVQVLSDLHLEVGRQYATFTFPVTAPLLLLAGDIGCLKDYDDYLHFLAYNAERFDKVLLVLGNHEFYDIDYEEAVDVARRLTTEPCLNNKVVLLHRARWDDPNSNLTILGCTLWSALPDEVRETVCSKVSDFRKIPRWTPARHDHVHHEEVTWLRESVAELRKAAPRRRILIATHHAPSTEGTSRPEQAASPRSPAFATNLLQKEQARVWASVNTWVFGHTHYTTTFERLGIQVVANQRGYISPGSYDAQKRADDGKPALRKQPTGHGLEFDAARSIVV